MNATSGFQEVGSLLPDHQQISSCTSNRIDSEKAAGTVSVLTISSLSSQASCRTENTLVTPFSYFHVPHTLELARHMKTKALALLALLLFAASACTTNTTVIVSVQQPALTGTNCKLQRELRNQDQKTDFWCWAASAHTVIEYVKNAPINQCDLVDAVFRSRLDEAWAGHLKTSPGDNTLALPNCCMSTEPSYPSDNQANETIAKSICLANGWPEYVFDTEPFRIHFEGYEYEWNNPGPQGLSWDEIVAEICADRPMISVVHFSPELGGGAHTVVIGGYNELEDGSQLVHVYDPGFNTLEDDYYLWPYDIYLGDPGVFTHVRDYKNISLP